MFQALFFKYHDTMGGRQVKKSAHTKLPTTTTPSGKHIDAGFTNYADDTAEQQIISWQTGPTKAAKAERWAQPGVADVTLEKKKSYLIRVQHIKNVIGKADNAKELAAKKRQAVEEGQDRLAKHLEPHEIVLNVNKLETIPTLIGQSSRQATRELDRRGTEQGEIKRTARYLGPMLSHENAMSNELKARKSTMIAAFETLSGFWAGGRHSWETTKLVLQSNVFTSGLSAHECFKCSNEELKSLDKCWIELDRRAMAGKATTKITLKDNEGTEVYSSVRAMSNEQITKY